MRFTIRNMSISREYRHILKFAAFPCEKSTLSNTKYICRKQMISFFEIATLKIMPRSQKCASTCIKQSIFSHGYIDFGPRSCSPYTCVNNQANHAERCFIHRPVSAPRQDAKFLIRREIWLSTGSNRVGCLAEDRYSSEIANGIARLEYFFQCSLFCLCNYAITSDVVIITLCV